MKVKDDLRFYWRLRAYSVPFVLQKQHEKKDVFKLNRLEELHRFRPTLKIKVDEIDDLVNISTALRLCLLTIACQKYVL